MNKTTLREIFSFAIVGFIGFGVDSGLLYLLKPALGHYGGRAISFFLAVVTTWLLNRLFTFKFKKTNKSLLAEFLQYLMMMLAGGSANYGVYAGLVTISPFVYGYPIIGVAIGSIAGMAINYLQLRLLMFKSSQPKV